ncbi:FK506-binding protein 4-like [Homarus americanus]|uniref:FK506-binding protein 4-like n=1 Tax=Homarus americanus TaxID=6706 RepID=UPI001C497127|nr:FK506-binding protein 4-like [Homarus americanus]
MNNEGDSRDLNEALIECLTRRKCRPIISFLSERHRDPPRRNIVSEEDGVNPYVGHIKQRRGAQFPNESTKAVLERTKVFIKNSENMESYPPRSEKLHQPVLLPKTKCQAESQPKLEPMTLISPRKSLSLRKSPNPRESQQEPKRKAQAKKEPRELQNQAKSPRKAQAYRKRGRTQNQSPDLRKEKREPPARGDEIKQEPGKKEPRPKKEPGPKEKQEPKPKKARSLKEERPQKVKEPKPKSPRPKKEPPE